MGAWSYCECGQGQNRPTPQQVIDNSMECPVCHRINEPGMTMGELLLELIERVDELEKKMEGRT